MRRSLSVSPLAILPSYHLEVLFARYTLLYSLLYLYKFLVFFFIGGFRFIINKNVAYNLTVFFFLSRFRGGNSVKNA